MSIGWSPNNINGLRTQPLALESRTGLIDGVHFCTLSPLSEAPRLVLSIWYVLRTVLFCDFEIFVFSEIGISDFLRFRGFQLSIFERHLTSHRVSNRTLKSGEYELVWTPSVSNGSPQHSSR